MILLSACLLVSGFSCGSENFRRVQYFQIFISNCLILNFSILQTCGSDSTVVSVLDLKTVLVLVDFSVDECSRWGVKIRLELEKMTNFKILEICV